MTQENFLKNRIMLINPPGVCGRFSSKTCFLPLGLAYLGAVLKENDYGISCLDAAIEDFDNEKYYGPMVAFGLSIDDIKERILETKPCILGISCIFTNKYHLVKQIAIVAKEVGVPYVVLGGNHATAMAKEILEAEKSVDFIILGEGERSFLNLVNRLTGRTSERFEKINGLAYRAGEEIRINSNIDFIKNLDELPFPARDLFPVEKYFKLGAQYGIFKGKRETRRLSVITSRGCPAKCTFCSSTIYWGPIPRLRSPENVLAELMLLKEKYGMDEIEFVDDNLTFDNERFKKIANSMIENKFDIKWFLPNGVALYTLNEELISLMKKSGCEAACLAIESGNQNTLSKIMRKPLDLKKVPWLCSLFRKYKIKTGGFFIVGMPGETLESIKDTFNFAAKVDIDIPLFNYATPLPGTELYRICVENGYINKNYSNAEYSLTNISTPEWSAKELSEFAQKNMLILYLKLFLKNPLRFLYIYSEFFFQGPKNTLRRFLRLIRY